MTGEKKETRKGIPRWDEASARLTESGLPIKEVYSSVDFPAEREEGIGPPGPTPSPEGFTEPCTGEDSGP